ncbi:cytochrome P450 2W1 isoform X3 [Acinonyx jubatus]|uniref:Cytochrome P450 2W1 isoform X3 n=1 Tax=Acinonyx jubatus TaxID=32536 RepID=A0ABM3PBT0_ACIJB|nr:cytochrome P450 2W1 isoform X3 [Acinonyx jubatus]
MALLLVGLLLLLGLWGLLRAHTRTPSPAPRWPPGPRPLPLIGNLHLLCVSQQDRSLMELSERYGPVFTVHLGLQKTVVLAGYEAVREALVGTGSKLADRPPVAVFQLIQGGGGIFFSSGARWRAARQFTVRTLHDLGVGRGPMVDKILQELRCLMGQLDSYGGRPFPLALLGWAPSNITFTLLFGRRFDYQDPVFVSLLRLIDDVMVLLGTPSLQLFNIYPWLGALLQLHRPVLRKIEEVRAILRTLLETRRPPAPGAGPVQSYMDALIQQGQGKDPHGLFAEADMVACVLDMVMAGTETTSATLQWAALLMSRHPSVQGEPPASLSSTRRWAGSPRARGGGGRGSRGRGRPPSRPQAGCRRSWTGCWGPGALPGWRTSGHCPTPAPCCTRSSAPLLSCPTRRGAWRLTPSWAATCSPRWAPLLAPDRMGRAPLPLSALRQAGPSWVSRGTPPGGGGAGPSPPAAPPTGHTRDPSAELGAPGQDAVGDPSPVQPGSLPGRRRALCEAGSLPAFLCRYPQLAGRGGTGSLTPKEPAHQEPRKLRPPGLPLPTASSTPSLPLGAGPHLALGSPPLQGTGQPPGTFPQRAGW